MAPILNLNPEHLVFIDEMGARQLWCGSMDLRPRGRRHVASAGALRCDAIAESCVFDAPMNGARFSS
jgi:hypothetical protein